MKTKRAILSMLILLVVIGVTAYVTGGDLNPGNTPSPTMRTLDELYKNIQPGLPSDWTAFPQEGQVTGNSSVHLQLEIEGSPVQGSVEVEGKEETIRCVGLGHEVDIPYDLATGQKDSLRHHPLVITKYIDKATPLLYQAMVQNREVTLAELKFYRTGSGGGEERYYTIRLQEAYIVNIRSAFPNLEQISIAYCSIEWVWEDGGITANDDCHQPG